MGLNCRFKQYLRDTRVVRKFMEMQATAKESINRVARASKYHLEQHLKDPWGTKKKAVTSMWLLANVSLFPYFISAAVACGVLESNNSGQAGFTLIWTFLNCTFLCVVGSVILFKRTTEYYLGALTTGCVIMCSWLLQEAIVLIHYSESANISDPSAVMAALVFGVLILIGYIATGICLIIYRRELISDSFVSLGDDTANVTMAEIHTAPAKLATEEEGVSV